MVRRVHDVGRDPAVSTLRILVVDDDPLLAEMLRAMVRACVPEDSSIEVANSGAKAAALLESGAPYDAVLCDVIMPGMSGLDLYRRLERSANPMARRLVLVTGGAITEAMVSALARVPAPRLHKPFELAQLRAVLSAVLGPSSAPDRPPP